MKADLAPLETEQSRPIALPSLSLPARLPPGRTAFSRAARLFGAAERGAGTPAASQLANIQPRAPGTARRSRGSRSELFAAVGAAPSTFL